MQFSVATIAAYAALLSSASAHMIMKTPYPFGPGSLTKDPLHADGSDFPCSRDLVSMILLAKRISIQLARISPFPSLAQLSMAADPARFP